ncbi:hypothetical protein D9M69_395480 [compost metagenome]
MYTVAGQLALARRPPLIAERCLRTQFISPMVAPDLSSALLIACLSLSVMPSAGRASSEEPPPESRKITRSLSVRLLTSSSTRRATRSPASSGTGWAASTTSILRQSAPWP